MHRLPELSLETQGDVLVGHLTGAIDLANAAQIQAALTQAVANAAPGLVIDLSTASYFDSAGIRMLFNLASQLHDRGQSLHAVVPPDSRIDYLLAIVDMGSVVPCHPTSDAAVAAVHESA